MNEHSKLLSYSLGILFPFLLTIGIYIIVNGHISPGGGFQGGAIFASAYIVKYLSSPVQERGIKRFQIIEKATLLLILLIPILFLYTGLYQIYPYFNTVYLIGLNTLIGLKVACGLTILFFRFAFYETR